MCIVIDPPVFVAMLKPTDPEHAIYSPVKEWIEKGAGKFVLGGSTYRRELAKVGSILRTLTELEKRGKVVKADDKKVDELERAAKIIYATADFDDPHLVALVKATRCRLICVRDMRAHRFLRDSALYESPRHRPSLYTRAKNKNLLCDKHIAGCCK